MKNSKKAFKNVQFFSSPVQAGFPSPADDFIDKRLDLNEHLVKHPAATFFVRVIGDSMKGAGIIEGDILVVDKAKPVSNNAIVIAYLDGEFTVKRVGKRGEKIYLLPENPNFKPIEVNAEHNFEVWGVVTYVIHKIE